MALHFDYKFKQMIPNNRFRGQPSSDKQLNNLLFSASNKDKLGHNDSHEYSNSNNNSNYQQADECEQQYEFAQKSHDDHSFLSYIGPSYDFSQNFSQNSMMMASNRHDDSSRDYKADSDRGYKTILEKKKMEEIQFNEVLDLELNSMKQEIEKKSFQVSKLEEALKGCEERVRKKDKEISELEETVQENQKQMQQLREDKIEYFRKFQKKDEIFEQLRLQSSNLSKENAAKDLIIAQLRSVVKQLQDEIHLLNRNLAVYSEPDRKLLDFKGNNYQQYQSPINSKKTSGTDKLERELEKMKKETSIFEIEVSSLKNKLEDKDSRIRMMEDDYRKKMTMKDSRIQELQLKISQLKEQNAKFKAQIELMNEKMANSLNLKSKEVSKLNEKISQYEMRTKSLLDECRKKDEKVKDMSIESIQKTRTIIEKDKQLQDMRLKQQFDHHMVEEKDKKIQELLQLKKALQGQLDNEKNDKKQKMDKMDKQDKNERLKKERQTEKIKKDNEALKKNAETLEKEKEELSNSLKQSKRKIQQLTKKFQQAKSSYSDLQSQSKNRDVQSGALKQTAERALKQLAQTKKKIETIPELKNKIIILQSRLKQSQSIMRESNDFTQSINLYDKIQAMELRLQQKEKEIKGLKNMIKSKPMNSSSEHEQDLEYLEGQLQNREREIQDLAQQLQQKQEIIKKLNSELDFKLNTLDYTHGILANYEKEKIKLQQQKYYLQEKVSKYQEVIEMLEDRLRNKDQSEGSSRFEIKQLKERIKQLNDALILRQRKITPETMSQEDTVVFLLKTMRKVNRSADMLRLLARNNEFIEVFSKMQRQFFK